METRWNCDAGDFLVLRLLVDGSAQGMSGTRVERVPTRLRHSDVRMFGTDVWGKDRFPTCAVRSAKSRRLDTGWTPALQ